MSSAKETQFQTLYDYYFPKHGQYINKFYRRSFDATLFGAAPKAGEERHPVVIRANSTFPRKYSTIQRRYSDPL
ncbi:MAG TPA: hypothetical protein VF345_14140 [Chthoniobacterales bacterium]